MSRPLNHSREFVGLCLAQVDAPEVSIEGQRRRMRIARERRRAPRISGYDLAGQHHADLDVLVRQAMQAAKLV